MHDDHSKTIGKLNDLNVLWKKKIPESLSKITKIGQGCLCMSETVLSF